MRLRAATRDSAPEILRERDVATSPRLNEIMTRTTNSSIKVKPEQRRFGEISFIKMNNPVAKNQSLVEINPNW